MLYGFFFFLLFIKMVTLLFEIIQKIYNIISDLLFLVLAFIFAILGSFLYYPFGGLVLLLSFCCSLVFFCSFIQSLTFNMLKSIKKNTSFIFSQNNVIFAAILLPIDTSSLNFLIFSFLFLFSLILILYFTTSIIIISSIIIIVISTTAFLMPMFSFFFMAIFGSLILFLIFPYNVYTGFFEKQKDVIIRILRFLDLQGILDFLITFYIMFFCVDKKTFSYRIFWLTIVNLVYIWSARWHFYHSTILNDNYNFKTSLLIYVLLLLGIIGVYLRFLLNLSFMLVSFSRSHCKSLLSPTILYIFGDLEDLPPPQKPSIPGSDVSSNKKYSFINIDRSRKYYRQNFSAQNPSTFRYLGYFLGLSTVLATGFAAYYTKVQADMATIQAQQAILQSQHTAREADVAAVEAHLITQEMYYQRHPEDLPKK